MHPSVAMSAARSTAGPLTSALAAVRLIAWHVPLAPASHGHLHGYVTSEATCAGHLPLEGPTFRQRTVNPPIARNNFSTLLKAALGRPNSTGAAHASFALYFVSWSAVDAFYVSSILSQRK